MLRVLVDPLVDLIWIAGAVFPLGSAIALRPDRAERARLRGAAEASLTATA